MSSVAYWLRISHCGVDRREGHFPLSWLMDDVDLHAMLIRVDVMDQPAFDESLYPLFLNGSDRPQMYFLTLRHPVGAHQGTYGRPITSFACSIGIVRQYIHDCAVRENAIPYVDLVFPRTLDVDCYQLATYIMDVARPTPVMRCLQLPHHECAETVNLPPNAVEWMILHRGRLGFLESCLSSMYGLATTDTVSVALDEPVTDGHRALMRQYPGFQFFQAIPSGNGPGAMLDRLARVSTAEYLLQQDSDDLSCVDRRNVVLKHLLSQNLDIVSSHEVSVDDAVRQVQAVRCALELDREMHPAKLFSYRLPIAAIRRGAFLAAGGFSDRAFAQDAEFLFRAITEGLRIGGVSEFLFVRRRHAKSMSARSDTGWASVARQNLMKEWTSEFERWRKGSPLSELSFSKQRSLREDISLIAVQ